jgi:outer membrane protein assembly factor BamB
MLRLLVLFIVLAGNSLPDSQAAPGEWPRWRGSNSDGTVDTSDRMFDRPFELRVRWKRTLGAGYSGIAIAGGRAVTMFSDGAQDVVVALSAGDGREVWRGALGRTFPARDGSTGGPVSTPAIRHDTVFALGPRGNLVALRLSDGARLWTRDLIADFGAVEPHWGFTTSPLPLDKVVVIAAGGTKGRAIVGLDVKTGATVWTTGEDTVSYQSPALVTLAGRQVIAAAGDRFLYGLDPATGGELWKHEHGGAGFYGRIINPVRIGDESLLLTHKPDASILVQPGADATREIWTTRELKLNYATPVVEKGLVFGYSGTFLTAVDAATGSMKWRSRSPGDGFPILVDSHLVVLTKQGQLSVAPATDRGFEPKAVLDVLPNLSWTPPSFAAGRIFVRDSYETIAAVDVVPRRETTTTATPPAPRTGVLPGSRFERWVSDAVRERDPAAHVEAFLREQKTFPVIEGERSVHVLFKGDGADVLFRSDAIGTGVDWPLNHVGGTDLYYVSLELEPDARVSYQFVRPTGDTLADPLNRLKGASQNFAGEVSLLMMPRAERVVVDPASPLQGKMAEYEFDGGTASAAHLRWIGKRAVHVYLPPSYDADVSRRYKAVYVLYGEEMRQGPLAAALEAEMGSAIDELILVFVSSTSGYEYARSFREPHMRMMAERLVPWIDARFRTRPTSADRLLLGADEAGFAAIEIGLRYPAVFGRIAGQSLFPLSTGDRELMTLIDGAARGSQRFSVDWGRYDPRRPSDRLDVRDFSTRVHARLRARGFNVVGREWNDGSVVSFWSHRAVAAVRSLFAKEPR